MELIVSRQFDRNAVQVYLRDTSGGRRVIYGRGEDGRLQEHVADPANPVIVEIKPLLEVSHQFFDEMVQAFVEYGNRQGVVTVNENRVVGKLEATEKHLADLQLQVGQLLPALIEQLKTAK